MPGGLNRPALKQGLITAAPMFSAMAAGYASGRGPYAYMDQGAQAIQAELKRKRDEEAAAAASRAFSGLVPGGMGVTGSTMGGPGYAWSGPQAMPKADPGVYGAQGGSFGLPAADTGVAQGGLSYMAGEDPTLGLIKQFEGFRETPYWDVNALRTGYGSDTVTLADGTVQRVGDGTRVSREDADRDLQRRVQTEFMPIAAKAVGEDLFSTLAPNQKAALTSIAYNYGELPSSVAAAVRSGDPQAAAEAIAALGTHNGGINAGRRAQEARFYLAGDTGGGVTMSAQNGPAAPVDPMQDPYVQQLMQVMAMPGLTPEQQAVVQLQLKSRVDLLSRPQPGAEEEAARAMRARDADLLGYQRGSPEWTQYVVTGEMAKPPSPTDDMREYEFAKSQGYQGTFPQYQIDMKKAGASSTTVSVGDGMPGLGKLSPDYAYVMDPQGNPVIDPTTGLPKSAPVPGSPADQEAKAAAAKAEMRNEAAMRTAKIVTDKIQEARDILDKSSAINPATGFGAETASGYGGTNAADMKATVDTITSSIAFDRLQSMREASPTGGALGAVSDTEMRLLSAAIASLSQTQSPEQFAKHLDDVERIYGEVMKKFAAYPDAGGAAAVGATSPAGDTIPPGVDPTDWEYMTPEERALWK